MPLDEYHRKRDFKRTPEPRGHKPVSDSGRLFVVQKHAARQLHYDLRLEHDGVLLSWAVPAGPSLDPGKQRLAIQTEDHPVEYGHFEGIIPQGEYGGGTVMLWDLGRWRPISAAQKGYAEGKLKFELEGRKLRGRWALVRMKGEVGDGGKNWLLIKERDAEARSEQKYCVIDEEPFSVTTRRTLQEIAADSDRVWTAGRSVGRHEQEAEGRQRPRLRTHKIDIPPIPGAQACTAPPELALPRTIDAESVPDGDQWLNEIALAGKRLKCMLCHERVRLLTDHGDDWTGKLVEIADAAGHLPVDEAMLDGIIVVMDPSGVSNPAALREALSSNQKGRIAYHVFDMPWCEGFDLSRCSLIDRKQLLERLLRSGGTGPGPLNYVDHIQGHGAEVYEQACGLGARAIISKQAHSRYGDEPRSWIQIACPREDASSAGRDPGAQRSAADVVVQPADTIHGVRMTNPDRVYYPEHRITKRRLALFYEHICDWILPHIRQRPLSIYRCPQGYEKQCFFQKHLHDISDKHLRDVLIRKKSGEKGHIVIDDLAGLMTFVQWGVLEIHPWGCREDNTERPDRMIFDLDPGPDVPWAQIVAAALTLRNRLSELGLDSFVKTSGGKGLHVVVPLIRRNTWEQMKSFAAAVSREVVRGAPQYYVATMSKSKRPGKVFIDYFRNHRGSTCVAAYSTRARPGAPVSTPLLWEEIDENEIAFTVSSLPGRLAVLPGDPWEGFFTMRQSITKAMLKDAAAGRNQTMR